MTMITIGLGTTPCDEACAQTGVTANWIYLQNLECEVYRAALIAVHGPPPAGVTLAIRANRHDFGSYTELEARFDGNDAVACDFAAAIEDGLSHWIDAGFTAPVDYDDGGRERPDTRRMAVDCVVGALVGARRLVAGGFATERETRTIAHLTAAYPTCAVMADELLATIA